MQLWSVAIQMGLYPGKSKLGAIGGDDPSEVFSPGGIGVVSRSGGMSAELSLAIKRGGLGVSTCISMVVT